MSVRAVMLCLGVLVLAAGIAAGAYAVGSSQAPTEAKAADERRSAQREAFAAARRTAHREARRRGLVAGHRAGEARGRRAGRRRGDRAGRAAAEQQRAQQAQAAEAQRQQAIDQRAQERAENCGEPLFVDGYCPSDEEIEREGQAESLCGPGTEAGRREAARRGIDC